MKYISVRDRCSLNEKYQNNDTSFFDSLNCIKKRAPSLLFLPDRIHGIGQCSLDNIGTRRYGCYDKDNE